MRCSNSEIFRKLNLDLIDERSEIEFTLLSDLPNCRMINASSYLPDGTSAGSFDIYAVPQNAFECDSNSCQNSGTYTSTAAAATMIYRGAFDAREIAAGVMTFYVKAAASGTVTVLLSDTSTFTDADQYTASYTSGSDYQPITIDLSKEPTAVGDKWTPSANGVFVKFTFSNSADSAVGLSSISFFEGFDDFETIDVVKVGCLTDISGTIDIPAITSVCHEAGYDTSSLSFTRTVNGKTVTPNYHKLNPLMGKAVETAGSKNYTIKQTVGDDATVVIADLNPDECGFIAVQRTDACDLGLATLRRVYAPAYVGENVLETAQYQVIYDPATQASTFYFAPSLAGVEILISYPKKINVKRYTANKYNVGDVRVRARYKWTHSDKSEFIVTLPNVLITSFPMNLTRTEQDFSFTMTIQADNNGDFYYLDEVLD